MKTQLKVGDEVEYVPHALHGRQKYPDGGHSWVFGWLVERQVGKEVVRIIEELSTKRLNEQVKYLAKHSDPTVERRKLIPLRPIRTWHAKVRAVNDDGTVNLDIECGPKSGVTLHYDRIAVVDYDKVLELKSRQRDSTGMHPASALAHTCHKVNR